MWASLPTMVYIQNFYNILDHHHESAKDWVVVNWNLGNMCNYSCSYCNPGNWLGDFRNEGDLQIYLDNLDTIIAADKIHAFETNFVSPDSYFSNKGLALCAAHYPFRICTI